jgi:hypothetical protein
VWKHHEHTAISYRKGRRRSPDGAISAVTRALRRAMAKSGILVCALACP